MALKDFDRARAEAAVREFLAALGFDPQEPELLETPARVAHAYGEELLRGYGQDPAAIIASGSEEIVGGPRDAMVLEGIRVITVCPHHLMIGEGQATVAYLPGRLLLGLGTVARLVETFSRRLVLQEEVAGQVVDALMDHAGAQGAFCRMTLRHSCLRARGPEEHTAEATTYAGRGAFADPQVLALSLGRDIAGGS